MQSKRTNKKQPLLHPDIYKNPSLVNDEELRFELVAHRQLGKIREFLVQKPDDVTPVEWMTTNSKKIIEPALEQNGGKAFVTKFYKLLEHYSRKNILHLKLIIVGDTIESFRKDPDSRVLKINDSFLSALKKVTIKDLSSMLGDRFNFYVSFDSVQIKTWATDNLSAGRVVKDNLTGCYMSYEPPGDDYPASISMLYTCETDDSTAMLSTGLMVPLKPGKSFRESFLDAKDNQEALNHPINAVVGKELQERILSAFDEDFDLANGILNACIYYYSLEPDVKHLEPERDKKKAAEIARSKGVSRDLVSSYYPVTLLNWSYGKARTYSMDSTWVESYLRWQRCGPAFSQVKLIMVSEHERHYNKEKKDECVYSQQGAH